MKWSAICLWLGTVEHMDQREHDLRHQSPFSCSSAAPLSLSMILSWPGHRSACNVRPNCQEPGANVL
jgi:hypothetical protein